MYTPDKWVVITITSKTGQTHQRVLAGWYGGWAGSDSWKMNSGITKVEEQDEYYDFYGESGSVYRCYKAAYGLSSYTQQILEHYKKECYIIIDESYEQI